mmetsp:Transcript_33712/g.38330  ORF Transcript_33712/g.38330 Transcript_33712/m.38330 type:complete len:143 (-) Transcript_33712:123-551(-)
MDPISEMQNELQAFMGAVTQAVTTVKEKARPINKESKQPDATAGFFATDSEQVDSIENLSNGIISYLQRLDQLVDKLPEYDQTDDTLRNEIGNLESLKEQSIGEYMSAQRNTRQVQRLLNEIIERSCSQTLELIQSNSTGNL